MTEDTNIQYDKNVFLGEPDASELLPQYQIVSVSHLIPINVTYRDGLDLIQIRASVDYANRAVYLQEDNKYTAKETEELTAMILDHLTNRHHSVNVHTPDSKVFVAHRQNQQLIQERKRDNKGV